MNNVKNFVIVSTALTGFDEFDLRATGMLEEYYRTACAQIGEKTVSELKKWLEKKQLLGESDAPERKLDNTALSEKALAFAACAVTEMWYLGFWPELPPEEYGEIARFIAPSDSAGHSSPPAPNRRFSVSPQAYVEGLVWKTFKGHPMGAKPPGAGSWGDSPVDPSGKPVDPFEVFGVMSTSTK